MQHKTVNEVWMVRDSDGSFFFFSSKDAGNKFIQYDKDNYNGKSYFHEPQLIASSGHPINFHGDIEDLCDVIKKGERSMADRLLRMEKEKLRTSILAVLDESFHIKK